MGNGGGTKFLGEGFFGMIVYSSKDIYIYENE